MSDLDKKLKETKESKEEKDILRFVNGKILDSKGIMTNYDLLIEGERVYHIGNKIPPRGKKIKTIDLKGQLLIPGLIELHAHVTAPDSLPQLAASAARGGFTTVMMMPSHGTDFNHFLNPEVKLPMSLIPVGPLTKEVQASNEREIAEISKMKKNGIKFFTEENDSLIIDKENLHRELFENIQKSNAYLFQHDEVRPETLKKCLKLCKEYQVRYHILHVYDRKTVEVIREAKAQGVPVSAGVTPHHLVYSKENFMPTQDGLPVITPGFFPTLGNEQDREALQIGLEDGTLDIITSNHSTLDFLSLETVFPLLYTELVLKGRLPLQSLVAKMTNEVATLFQLDGGRLQEGGEADFTILDLSTERKVSQRMMPTLNSSNAGQNSGMLYLMDKALKGWAITTYSKGQKVFSI